MKKLMADLIFLIIAAATFIYVALTPEIKLKYIVLACLSIYFNYRLFDKKRAKDCNKIP